MRSLLTDLTPLRESVPYRRLWLGQTVSMLGEQMTALAVAIQVYAITGSSFSVGLVGLCALVPLVLFGLYGGSVADAVDRRRLGLLATSGLCLLSFVLFLQAALGNGSVALLYLVVALQSSCMAVNTPARMAIIPRLLPPEMLPAANALSTASSGLGFTVGPLVGALLIDWHGFSVAYAADCLSFGVALYALWRLPRIPVLGHPPRAGLRSVLEGLRFLRTRTNVLMTFLVDLAAMVLAQPRALFPALAATHFGGGARTVGLLAASPAAGALLGALFSGWLGRVRRQGSAVLICVALYGACIATLGLTATLWVALALLALSGTVDMISSVFRHTVLQVASPDALRGRLEGVFIVVVAGGPRLGDFTAGTVASLSVETFAVVSGGCACLVAVGLLAARFPRFVRYDAENPEP